MKSIFENLFKAINGGGDNSGGGMKQTKWRTSCFDPRGGGGDMGGGGLHGVDHDRAPQANGGGNDPADFTNNSTQTSKI